MVQTHAQANNDKQKHYWTEEPHIRKLKPRKNFEKHVLTKIVPPNGRTLAVKVDCIIQCIDRSVGGSSLLSITTILKHTFMRSVELQAVIMANNQTA